MQDMRGKVRRSLRVLRVAADAGATLDVGASIVRAAAEAPVGTVTSRAYSPRAGAWLVMAKVQLDALGGELWYEDARGRHPAQLAEPI